MNDETIEKSNLDDLFDNLSSDIANINQVVSDINAKKRITSEELESIKLERQKLDKDRADFDNYASKKDQVLNQKQKDIEDYLRVQKNNLFRAESEFKTNMSNALRELELTKKEFQMQKDKLDAEKNQFEDYKTIEMNRINHASEIFLSEKEQFEKYKAMTEEKLQLETRNLEIKCKRIKDMIGQFNNNFKPILEEE